MAPTQSQKPSEKTDLTLVRHLGANDVILGRGYPATLGNQGNIRCREIIKSLLPMYVATSEWSEKSRLARLVVDIIRRRSGRFVRRIESVQEAESLPPDTSSGVWIIVRDEVMIISKIKQSFRDQHARANGTGSKKKRKTSTSQSPSLVPTLPIQTGMTRTVMPPDLSPLSDFFLPRQSPSQVWTPASISMLPRLPHGTTPQMPLVTADTFLLLNRMAQLEALQTSLRNQDDSRQNTALHGLEILAQAALHQQRSGTSGKNNEARERQDKND